MTAEEITSECGVPGGLRQIRAKSVLSGSSCVIYCTPCLVDCIVIRKSRNFRAACLFTDSPPTKEDESGESKSTLDGAHSAIRAHVGKRDTLGPSGEMVGCLRRYLGPTRYCRSCK